MESDLDITFLHGLKVDAVIGIYEWERRIRQRLYIDLDMASDVACAARSDDIADAVDYKAVARRVETYAAQSDFGLVESLAEGIAAILLEEFAIPWVRVRINKKGAVRNAADVGIVIERGAPPESTVS